MLIDSCLVQYEISLKATGCLEVETENGRLTVLKVKRKYSPYSWAHGAGIDGDSCFLNGDKG